MSQNEADEPHTIEMNAIKQEERDDLLETNDDTENKVSEKGNKFETGLKINYACMCFFAFLTGTDFAVILPTLWDRLHLDFNASGTFMGVVISSYSFSGVICGLIMGHISDKINKTKPFYLIGIFLSIFGHLLYFAGINKYVILAARAVSGLCLGASTVALAYVARTTNESERISVISIIMATRQLGLMLGPAFNLFLRKANFVLFDRFVVNRWSVPGLFMALLWLICLFVLILFYHDDKKHRYQHKKEQTNPGQIDPKLTYSDYKKEFVRIEIFVLLLATFFTYFNQTSLETIVIPFTEIMFGWNELHNSILFCIGGTTIIISYVLIKLLSLKFKDRFILLLGLISIVTGLLIACSCLPFAKQLQDPSKFQISLYKIKTKTNVSLSQSEQNSSYLDSNATSFVGMNADKIYTNQTLINRSHDYQFFPAFVFFVLLDVLGLPAIAICSASLFTKLVNNRVQGFGQGIQRGILGLGTIFGPLCAGPFVQRPIYLLACTLTLIFLILIIYLVSYKKLNPDLFRKGQAKSNQKC